MKKKKKECRSFSILLYIKAPILDLVFMAKIYLAESNDIKFYMCTLDSFYPVDEPRMTRTEIREADI